MAEANDGREFNASIRDWAARFPEKMDALARQSSQELSERVVTSTPVDTGFLRSSWQPSLGKPALAKGEAGAQAQASAQVSLVITEMKAGDLYYLVNNAAYAKRIEWGFVGQDSLGRTYNQTGRHMVTDNVKRWNTVVESVAQDLGLK